MDCDRVSSRTVSEMRVPNNADLIVGYMFQVRSKEDRLPSTVPYYSGSQHGSEGPGQKSGVFSVALR